MDIVGNIRLVEDSLAAILLFIGLITLFSSWLSIKALKVRSIPLALALGLVPLFVWKGMGMVRRAFIDKSTQTDLYNQMHDIGEVFESLSGLALAIAVVIILMTLRKMVRTRRQATE